MKFDVIMKCLMLKKFLFILLCIVSSTMQAQIQCPEITFKYNWKSRIIDAIGNVVFGCKIRAKHRRELVQQLPDFIGAWKHNAPLFFDEIFSIFKRGFKKPKRTAIVYLSHNASYGSNLFLILGLRHYLNSESWMLSVSREDAFTDLVFHELLHVWVDDTINGKSTLLTKYCDEHEYVRDHIHVMAIQKMVYVKLNRTDMLDKIDEDYRKRSLPEYCRAWEIVNDIEGYEVVIQDIINTIRGKK